MRVYKFSIPIDDYYGDAVFFKNIYFGVDRCPTKDEVISALKGVIAISKTKHHTEDGENDEALRVIESTNEFPQCYGDLIYTNIRVNHPKWGDQPLSCMVVMPINKYPEFDL